MKAHLTILDEIGARLNSITVANGYTNAVDGIIKRASLKPFKNGDLPALNYWPTEDLLLNKEYGMEIRQLSVTVEGYTTTRDDPFTDVGLILGNDIYQALFRTTDAPLAADQISVGLGGLVDTLLVDRMTPVLGEGQAPWCGIVLELLVQYKINIGDPFTVA